MYWSTVSGTGTGGTVVNVSSAPFYHDRVTNTTPYFYVITAVNGAGESSATSKVAATPMDIPLSGLFFTDANLAACVNALALINVNEVTSLSCNSSSISDITGIEALTSLGTLSLQTNTITDISALAGLTRLITLGLSVNTITDVSPLTTLTKLDWLELGSNTITDVGPLTTLTSLTLGLRLSNNTITDVGPLANLTSLTELYLDNNSIGGQGVGNVDSLITLASANGIYLTGNAGMSCAELTTLITALLSPPVDTDNNLATMDVATNTINCTNP